MVDIQIKENCTGCCACANQCPVQCISMKADDEGFAYPQVDASKCIDCHMCEAVCPVGKSGKHQHSLPNAYAAVSSDETTRLNSSSGGIFSLLAKRVFEKGGVVFGAAFDEQFGVHHIGVDTVHELDRITSSKYVQSEVGECFSEVKQHLEARRWVLFSGTPCQVAGLNAYLGDVAKDKLVLVDLVCHGVPSPAVWQAYLQENNSDLTKIREIQFRCKQFGWNNNHFRIIYDDAQAVFCQPALQNVYMRGFSANLTLRPSCYACSFKTLVRDSDLTLADFWGIKHLHPEMYDNKGCSLVLVHSDTGEKLMAEIAGSIQMKQVNAEQAVTYNPAAVRAATLPAGRDVFFDRMKKGEPVTTVLNELGRVSFQSKIKAFGKKILNSIRS